MKKFMLLLFVFLSASDLCAQTYWIAFAGSGPHNNEKYYLMRIDPQGNVISVPALIWQKKNVFAGITLTYRDMSTLNLWVSGTYRNPKTRRIVIDKNKSMALKVFKTNLITANGFPGLEATQKQSDNFLAYPSRDGVSYQAVRVTNNGTRTSEKWTLLRNPQSMFDHAYRMSADGRVLLYSGLGGLVLQRLDVNGKVIGKAQILKCCTSDIFFNGFSDADASNTISGSKRIIIYNVQRRSQHDDEHDHLYSRVVDASTLKPLKKPVLVHSSPEVGDALGGIYFVCIDPLGRFLLYMESFGDSYLVFQPLDADGRRTGQRKILVKSNYIGDIDLLKE